jgi:hypothetical protein
MLMILLPESFYVFNMTIFEGFFILVALFLFILESGTQAASAPSRRKTKLLPNRDISPMRT